MHAELQNLAKVAHRRKLDRAAAELVVHLRANGVPSILLKGPATARVLYPNEQRLYGDIDLLVSPANFDIAADLVHELGFVSPNSPQGRVHAWAQRQLEGKDRQLSRASDDVALELHRSFHLLNHRTNLLALLDAHTELITIDGVAVCVPNPAAVAVLCLLHARSAALDNAPKDRLVADVRRAAMVVEPAHWREAAHLANKLGTAPMCVAALRELGAERGAEVARTAFAGVGADPWLTAHLRGGSALAFRVLNFRARSWPSRAAWVVTRPFPSLRSTNPSPCATSVHIHDNGVKWALADASRALKIYASCRLGK
jgi:hypothetical protein